MTRVAMGLDMDGILTESEYPLLNDKASRDISVREALFLQESLVMNLKAFKTGSIDACADLNDCYWIEIGNGRQIISASLFTVSNGMQTGVFA